MELVVVNIVLPFFVSLSLSQYTLDPVLTVDAVTVSAWANTGPTAAWKETAIRLYDTTSSFLDQKNSFEFLPGGTIFAADHRKGFMMAAVLKGGIFPLELYKSEDDGLPVDQWFYASTTYDGATGGQRIFNYLTNLIHWVNH